VLRDKRVGKNGEMGIIMGWGEGFGGSFKKSHYLYNQRDDPHLDGRTEML